MSILLIVLFFNVIAAFVSGFTGHMIWCAINIVLAVLMLLAAIVYEGRLLNRIENLEKEVNRLPKENFETFEDLLKNVK